MNYILFLYCREIEKSVNEFPEKMKRREKIDKDLEKSKYGVESDVPFPAPYRHILQGYQKIDKADDDTERVGKQMQRFALQSQRIGSFGSYEFEDAVADIQPY